MSGVQSVAPAAISEQVALQAAEWFFLLQSGAASGQDRQRWQHWHAAHPAHAAAWERAERVGQSLGRLPPKLALPVLNRSAVQTVQRRRAVKALALLLVAAPTGWLAWRHGGAADLLADLHTATGERRTLQLADGSRLQLDTASAVNIKFDSDLRLLHLLHGAIHIETAADAQLPPRPLVVATAQGRMRALGTRFTVRQDGDTTRVAVLDGAVELRPRAAPELVLVLQAGQQTRMTAQSLAAAQPVTPDADGWAHGVLQVRNMRLADFAAELGRYRPGVLHCDPAVAELRISGTFQLQGDTTAVLESLPQVLPVAVRYRTRYWITLVTPP
ncbi:FecR domain-containing protein [Comamonas composti]|uniref:FecR domain-containing protein n=1 Tax=Comamonas composti TaxID=408558 RepID=UPI00047BE14F|nr:FecR domain-containing protein [Comamonas composti]